MVIIIALKINKVMSCQIVLSTAQDERKSNEFSALVYAALERFEIDNDNGRMMISKWYVRRFLELKNIYSELNLFFRGFLACDVTLK